MITNMHLHLHRRSQGLQGVQMHPALPGEICIREGENTKHCCSVCVLNVLLV